ncbi:condensation domain-containing protein [Streptomyces sp. HNM0663]|uniref:Condensation domain-containing protein n=1 Tax=Streptomyces chengmaiensis TaxID=3040919 RepID=A0ABT6HS28_9ACTN|nr:condensation domain-containing protein [Streptomyces chengmaiensis]MDH2391126.1 condensation domain-containing protein [Streptomyces chengmaiensis]
MQSSNITSLYLTRYRRLGTDALLPVTGAQRRFLLARRMDPSGRPAVVPLFFAFPSGTLDLARLRTAADRLAAAHPALRARPETLRGTPVQRMGDPVAEVRRAPRQPGESAADALLRTLTAWSAEGPPLRLYLADDGPEEILAVAMDHAVCDEQSLGAVLADLSAAYRDRLRPEDVEPRAAAEALQGYRDAVHLQLDAEARASSGEALAYWAQRLAPLRPAAPARRPGAGQAAGTAQARLPVADGDRRAAAFPVLLDACADAARVLYGPDCLPPLGYPWGGRPAAAPPVLGCFLNTVVHPAAPGADPAAWWDDLDHADTPFDEVTRAARAAGCEWSGALDGLLTFEDLGHRPELVLGGVTGRETHIDGRPVQGPFAVSVSYGADLLVRMTWDRAAVADGLAQEAFARLLDALAR